MEMQQLRYVVAVARARNFSRAGGAMSRIPAVRCSQQIQKLEEEFGRAIV